MDCVFCWQFNSTYSRQDVQLKNSKYCKLYTDYENMSKKQIINFKDCETLYTKCDCYLEQNVHEYILKLEKLLKDHQLLTEQEMKMQNVLINNMWIQSQRYLILKSSGVCVKPYPEIVSIPTEIRTLCSFHLSLRKLNKSNCILAQSMENVRTCQTELNRRCEQLDMSIESPFINGNYLFKSLSYIRNILNDLIHYFNCNLCRLNCCAQFLDPGDSVSIEDYKNLIKYYKKSEFVENLRNCH